MMKSPIKMYPFSVIYPPYTPEKQKMVKILCGMLDVPQYKFFKRTIWLLIILYILYAIVTKKITVKKVKKVFNMIKMMLQMIFSK